MANLLYTELLKLKRSQMFLVSILGAAAAPFICFISSLAKKAKYPDVPIRFSETFSDTNLYIVLLIGVPLYGVITSYLFNREYAESTLKNLLTIPVSRISLIVSKLVLLLIWIMMLTLIAWVLTLLFGLIGQFEGLSSAVLIDGFQQFMIGGALLFFLVSPIIFVTLLFKNYVPTIIFTIIISMVSIMVYGTEYSALLPWSAVWVIASGTFFPEYPPEYSFISVAATTILGLAATIVYFKKIDIH
ncbi:ABC transporter permease [Bacillus paralicheniformis]|uniref:ABC transporter permease n=1 Tax=Bacillus paralicheniformis TaxID=1648923 RepID=UPI00227DD094|nr:ABC transporter permease [Bacillus paralicheniformis]